MQRQPGQPGRQIWLYEHLLVLSAATPPLLLAMAERTGRKVNPQEGKTGCPEQNQNLAKARALRYVFT